MVTRWSITLVEYRFFHVFPSKQNKNQLFQLPIPLHVLVLLKSSSQLHFFCTEIATKHTRTHTHTHMHTHTHIHTHTHTHTHTRMHAYTHIHTHTHTHTTHTHRSPVELLTPTVGGFESGNIRTNNRSSLLFESVRANGHLHVLVC